MDRPPPFVRTSTVGHGDDEQWLGTGPLAELRNEFMSVEIGKAQVRDHDIGQRFRHLQCHSSGTGRRDPVAAELEEIPQ